MAKVEIEVLTQVGYPVVRMPGRRYPGVVIQGDTLSTFVSDAKGLVADLRAGKRPLENARYLADELYGVLDHYARTLAAHASSYLTFPMSRAGRPFEPGLRSNARKDGDVVERRSGDELRAVVEPAWPEIERLLRAAPGSVRTLAASESRRDVALEAVQVTVASFLGALLAKCGGLVIDDGWLRILAAGTEDLPGVHEATQLTVGSPSSLDVAWDVLGGRFAINGGELPAARGEVCYFGPDTLEWTGTGGGHSAFVRWALTGGTTDFYASLRWPGWQREVSPLRLDTGLSVYPPPFTAQGHDLAASSRRPVPLRELHDGYSEIAAQIGECQRRPNLDPLSANES